MKIDEKNKELETEMQSLIQEIEEQKSHKHLWVDWNDKIEEVKAMPPEKQKNWLMRCERCGRAFVKDSDKSHRQKYCYSCAEEVELERGWIKSRDTMIATRMAKGMSEDEAWDDMRKFFDRQELRHTQGELKKKSKKKPEKKVAVSDSVITKYCKYCGKKITYKHSDGAPYTCDECYKKFHPEPNKTVIAFEGMSDFCENCGKELSRRDKERKNNPYHMCAQCRKKILDSEWGKYHKARGFRETTIVSSYKNTENPLEFKLEMPKGQKAQRYIEQEQKRRKIKAKELREFEKLEDADVGYCEDCCKWYLKENRKASNQKRCPKCQEKHDKEYKKQKAQEARDKAKAEKVAAELAEAKAKAKEESAEARKKYKAEWAREYRAKKKLMKL